MSRMLAFYVGLLVAWTACSATVAGDSPSHEPAPVQSASEREQQLEESLKRPVELNLVDVSLTDAMAKVSDKAGVELRLDRKTLANAAIDPSALVTFKTPRPMPLEEALQEILDDFELTVVIEHEWLKVTSKEKADSIVMSRVYPVGDLVANRAAGHNGASVRYLIDMIEDLIAPDSWDKNHGTGTIAPADMPGGPALVVTTTRSAHQRLVALLAELRAGKTAAAVGEGQIEAALNRSTTFDIVELPIADAVANLAAQHKIPITLDNKALADAAFDPSTLVSCKTRRPISLGAALDLMLDDVELTHVIQRGMLRITSKEKADSIYKIRVYPVDDLVQATSARQANEGQLAGTIMHSIAMDSWDENSGAGALRFVSGPKGWLAVVSNTDRVHRDVADLLARLRETRKAVAARQPAAVRPAATTPGAAPATEAAPPPDPVPEAELEEVALKLVRYELRYIDAEQAMRAITELVAPKSWRAAGGPGAICVTKLTQQPSPGVADAKPTTWTFLAVRQKPSVHRKIRKLLREIDQVPFFGLGTGVMAQ